MIHRDYGLVFACLGYLAAGLILAVAVPFVIPVSGIVSSVAGIAASASAILIHVVAVSVRDRSFVRTATAQAASALPRLEERLDGLEHHIAQLSSDLKSAQNHQMTDVVTEITLLRSLVEKLAVQHLAPISKRDTPLRSDSEDMAYATSPSWEPRYASNVLSVLRSALEESRVDLYLQPVVKLPSRRVAHYETFSRVRDEDGAILAPMEYLAQAESAGLVASLDNLLMFRSISLIRKLGPRRQGVRLFSNLSPAALEDANFLHELVSFMRAHPDLADRLVFELSAENLGRLSPEVRTQLSALARLGFAFSIDHIPNLDSIDPARLAAMNVQYVKINAQVILGARSPIERRDIKDFFARYNIELIATHIEEERTVVEVLELGIDYGQGYLFGEPRPARSDVDQRAA